MEAEKLTIFGRELSEKSRLPDDISIRVVTVGLFTFSLEYHCEGYPLSPYHGVAGKLSGGGRNIAFRKEGEHGWLGTEEEVVSFLESEARRIIRECLEIAGRLEASSCELLEPARVRFRDE